MSKAGRTPRTATACMWRVDKAGGPRRDGRSDGGSRPRQQRPESSETDLWGESRACWASYGMRGWVNVRIR